MTFALRGARIHSGDQLIEDAALVISDGKIVRVVAERDVQPDAEVVELDGGILAAGFIDTQVNGGGGALFNATPTVEAIRTIGEAHRSFGTTGFLPTLISDDIDVIAQGLRAVETAIEQGVPGVLGVHIEGPMLAPSRNGIHDARFLRGANRELIELVSSMRLGRTMVTIAPEIVGPDVIAQLVAAGVIVAAGHTEATYDEMNKGLAAGITGVTHLFNAMSQMANRAPGVVGASLENQRVWCGIIADGVHVHPASLRIAMRSRPWDRFMLVTDAMPPVGTDATEFELQGRRILVTEDRCIDDQGTLAGANLTMAGAVRNCRDLLDLPLWKALRLASASPAAFLGLSNSRGAIAPGQAADLVWLGEDCSVRATWQAGHRREGGHHAP